MTRSVLSSRHICLNMLVCQKVIDISIITKMWTNKICIEFQRIWIQSLIFVTVEQMYSPLIRSPSSGVDFRLKSLDLWLENLVFGVEGTFCVLVLFSYDHEMFSSRWKRSLLKSLIFLGWGHIYMFVLFSRDLQTFSFCWKRRS